MENVNTLLPPVIVKRSRKDHPGTSDNELGSRSDAPPPEQETQACIGAISCPGPEFLLAAYVPVNSCRVPRRLGRITHQQENIPYEGFGPDLPCYPPQSHGSLRFEVDDRRAWGSELTASLKDRNPARSRRETPSHRSHWKWRCAESVLRSWSPEL